MVGAEKKEKKPALASIRPMNKWTKIKNIGMCDQSIKIDFESMDTEVIQTVF